jgi:hypothetical protein
VRRLSGVLTGIALFLPLAPVWAGQAARPFESRSVAPGAVPLTGRTPNNVEWPCMLGVPSSLVPAVRELWEASPTFRGQCRQLADANITVAVGLSPLLPSSIRAVSKILRREGHVFFVSTTLRDDVHVDEDLPHELEHAIEQLEGRDLQADAAAGRAAWSSTAHGFETRRAHIAGTRARNEMKAARRSGSSQTATLDRAAAPGTSSPARPPSRSDAMNRTLAIPRGTCSS